MPTLFSDKKIKILEEILGSCSKVGSEFLFFCPKCKHHKKKLSINIEKDKFKCWICDWSGTTIKRIVVRNGNFSQNREWNELTGVVDLSDYEKIFFAEEKVVKKEETLSLPEEFQSLCNKDNSLTSLQARRYLKERGISKEDILFWKIGYCVSGDYEGRVIIPSFNLDGKVNYFVARRYDDINWQKYMNPSASKDIIFNELYLDWTQDITIVEGVFDAIKAKNAIPLLGSTLREGSRLFKELIRNDPAIYIALDPDAERKAEKLIKDLLTYDAEVYKIPIPAGKDVGDMTHEEFLECKQQAVLIKDNDYLLMSKIWSL
jgi:DNA primase